MRGDRRGKGENETSTTEDILFANQMIKQGLIGKSELDRAMRVMNGEEESYDGGENRDYQDGGQVAYSPTKVKPFSPSKKNSNSSNDENNNRLPRNWKEAAELNEKKDRVKTAELGASRGPGRASSKENKANSNSAVSTLLKSAAKKTSESATTTKKKEKKVKGRSRSRSPKKTMKEMQAELEARGNKGNHSKNKSSSSSAHTSNGTNATESTEMASKRTYRHSYSHSEIERVNEIGLALQDEFMLKLCYGEKSSNAEAELSSYARYLLSTAGTTPSKLLPPDQVNDVSGQNQKTLKAIKAKAHNQHKTHPLRPEKGHKKGLQEVDSEAGIDLLPDLTYEVANWCSDAEPSLNQNHGNDGNNGSEGEGEGEGELSSTRSGGAGSGPGSGGGRTNSTSSIPYVLTPHHRGTSLLHVCAYTDHLDGVQLLISNHANVNARTSQGETALHWAASRNSFNTAALLLDFGANLFYKDGAGCTPLIRAGKSTLLFIYLSILYLYLCTGGVLFHVNWCIRKLWSSLIMLYSLLA